MNVENQSNKKQRMFANPFSFKGRIGRLEFCFKPRHRVRDFSISTAFG